MNDTKSPNAKPVTIAGKTYPSIVQCCKALGISASNVNYLIWYYKLKPEQAIQRALYSDKVELQSRMKVNENNDVIVHGIKYTSVRNACEKLGLNYHTVTKVKNKSGKSYSEVLEYYADKNRARQEKAESIKKKQDNMPNDGGKNRKDLVIYGETFVGLKDTLTRLGISPSIYYDERKSEQHKDKTDGEVIEYILECRKAKESINGRYGYNSKQLSIHGKTYYGLRKTLGQFGISYTKFKRVAELNENKGKTDGEVIEYILDAANTNGIPNKRQKPVCIDGIAYNSLKECLEELGINYGSYYAIRQAKAHKDKTDEELITHIINYRLTKEINSIIVRGIEFTSVTQCLKHFNIPYSAYRKHRDHPDNQGKTDSQILELILNERTHKN